MKYQIRVTSNKDGSRTASFEGRIVATVFTDNRVKVRITGEQFDVLKDAIDALIQTESKPKE